MKWSCPACIQEQVKLLETLPDSDEGRGEGSGEGNDGEGNGAGQDSKKMNAATKNKRTREATEKTPKEKTTQGSATNAQRNTAGDEEVMVKPSKKAKVQTNPSKKGAPPLLLPGMIKSEDYRLQGWHYERGKKSRFQAPNGKLFNSKEEAINYAIKFRSDQYQLSKTEIKEGWILNPISQRIRIARTFQRRTKYSKVATVMLGTVVATLLKFDSPMLFMNLHDDKDIETIDWPELEAGKVLFKEKAVLQLSKQKYAIGAQIECKYRGPKGRFYPGVIRAYNLVLNSYTVDYDDGEVDTDVKDSFEGYRLRKLT